MPSLNEVLFELDPSNTCCVENGAYGEYDMVAARIDGLMLDEPNMTMSEAIELAFDMYELEISKEDIASVVDRMKN